MFRLFHAPRTPVESFETQSGVFNLAVHVMHYFLSTDCVGRLCLVQGNHTTGKVFVEGTSAFWKILAIPVTIFSWPRAVSGRCRPVTSHLPIVVKIATGFSGS